MSNDLQWFLLRNSNAFIVKRVPEGPIFSKEPGNLTNIHSFKNSGLANSKTIAIADSPSGVQVTTIKKGSSPLAVQKSKTVATIRNRSGGRRAAGVVAQLAKRGYRPDLRKDAVARVSALIAAQKEKKSAPPRKIRGKKAAEIAKSLS